MALPANNPAGSALSVATTDLAALALDMQGWSVEKAEAIGADPAAALAALEARDKPLKDVEPRGGKHTDALKRSLGLIGAKIAPAMSEDQGNAWASAMVMALSDLPGAFVRRGAEDALHVPTRFLNEVEGVIREKAALAKERHQRAVNRLRRFQQQMHSAKQPALPKPVPELTQDGINAMPLALLKIGLAKGYITQEQYDIATRKDDQ